MKFRLPFQIYRTGVISRSSCPAKILNKFSKDNEAKVRKKTSKMNTSYRAIIRNFIFSFKNLPLKITLSKLRTRNKNRISTRPRKANIRNEFLYLQEMLKDNYRHKKLKNRVANETSESCMNSIKCANFMCAKSTAKILLRQKDLLCNKNSKKGLTGNKDEDIPKENTHSKNELINSTNVEKGNKGTTNITPLPSKNIENTVEMPIKDKYKPNEYKWKFNKLEVASNAELKLLKSFSISSDEGRNYKIEEAPSVPIRTDNINRASYYSKKLPELPVQNVPKVEQVPPKETPSLVAPKRKYDAPEITRNYKTIETVHHSPPRMDNLIGCKTEPKHKSSDNKSFYENITTNSKHIINRSNSMSKGKTNAKYYPDQIDVSHDLLLKNNSKIEMNKHSTVSNEKDAFLLKLDQVVCDLIPKTKRTSRDRQKLIKVNMNVLDRSKKIEELIENKYDQPRSKSEECKSRIIEEQFLIQEIRRKYYPPDTFGKERPKQSIPSINAVPLMEPNDIKTNTKFRHLYSMPREQHQKLDENTSGNTKNKHTNIKNSITCNSDDEKQKLIVTIDVDNSYNDSLGDCSTCSTNKTSMAKLTIPKNHIPPTSKTTNSPANKPTSTLCSNVEKKISANNRKSGEINSEAPRAKTVIRTDSKSNNILQDFDNLQQDRRFSTDVLALNLEDGKNYSSDRKLSEVTSTLDNKNNVEPPVDGSKNITRELSYQYFQQCIVSKNVDDFEMGAIYLPTNNGNEQSSATLEINAADLITNEKNNNMLIDKTTLIKNYINWKMQFQKFESSTNKCSKSSKCCLSLQNKVGKQNKYRTRIIKIIQLKQRNIINNISPVRPEQNDLVNSRVNLLKSQVAHKCVMLNKISDALLKKTDIINNNNHANQEMQQQEQKLEYLLHNKKRKLSRVPMLDVPPKKKVIPIPEVKINMIIPETKKDIPTLEINKKCPVLETKNVIPVPEAKNVIPIPEVKNVILLSDTRDVNIPSEVNVPQLQVIPNVSSSKVEEEICSNGKNCSQTPTKLIGPKMPSRKAPRLVSIRANKSDYLQFTSKNKSSAIPATIKAKRFLAKIEAEQKEIENMLTKKINKKLKYQNSVNTKLPSSENIGK